LILTEFYSKEEDWLRRVITISGAEGIIERVRMLNMKIGGGVVGREAKK
jgi:hypothetical protein